MLQFRGVHNVTFRFEAGVYETGGNYELPSSRESSPEAWEPDEGWRMIGAGIDQTILKLTSPLEELPTKYAVVGNSRSGRVLRHFELAHMTIDANGQELAEKLDSNFGCVFLTGTYIFVHDLLCLGGFNALSPHASNAATHRELFILGLGGRSGFHATNNVIERCEVRISPSSPKAFPGAIEGLTTAIVNGANTFTADGVNYLSYSPVIRDCFVRGTDPRRRLNGISMFGTVDGITVSNRVTDARFGFYSDDGLVSPRAFITGNTLSNVVVGVYFNYNGSSNRWDQLAILNNDILLWADPDNFSPDIQNYGINLVGAPDPMPASFYRTVVAGNQIHSARPAPSRGRPMDYGIQVVRHSQACVSSNTIDLLRDRNALKVLREPVRGEEYLFTNNVNARGLQLIVHDRSLPGCRSDDPPSVEQCRYVSDYFWPPVVSREFGFASRYPRPLEYPWRTNATPRVTLLWTTDSATLTGLVRQKEAGSETSVVSRKRNEGSLLMAVYAPIQADYYMWLRIASQGWENTGFFDVEVDGVRQLFGLTTRNATTNWTWQALTERVPIVYTNRLRLLSLDRGWHEIRLFTRDPGVKVSRFCLTTAEPSALTLNDRIMGRLEADGRFSAETASEDHWSTTVLATEATVHSPMEWVRNESHLFDAYVASPVEQRGEVVFRVPIPRTGDYEAALLMAPDRRDPSHASGYLIIDGREWTVACDYFSEWRWTTYIGASEQAARAAKSNRFRLAPGWHTIAYRCRQSGVGIGGIRMSAVP
ncbi:MAG: hypothetical protein HYR88_10175 [Verrucomicrobia bacterium]|nr:hypothetical protein [Verrucomicrobiota bacterium]